MTSHTKTSIFAAADDAFLSVSIAWNLTTEKIDWRGNSF